MAAMPPETSVIEHELRVAARPKTVFAFFTDPAKMVQWMGAEATLDPRPGGICRIAFQPTRAQVESLGTDLLGEQGAEPIGADAAAVMSGRYVEVDPYRRIELTWGWEQELLAVPPQSTIVEVSFVPDGEGTMVRFTHRQIPPATVAYHRAGWEHYLGRLAIAAAGGDPGPDPWQRTADDRS
jgi:uncharacterized protein YndB with AHSA1/START domain